MDDPVGTLRLETHGDDEDEDGRSVWVRIKNDANDDEDGTLTWMCVYSTSEPNFGYRISSWAMHNGETAPIVGVIPTSPALNDAAVCSAYADYAGMQANARREVESKLDAIMHQIRILVRFIDTYPERHPGRTYVHTELIRHIRETLTTVDDDHAGLSNHDRIAAAVQLIDNYPDGDIRKFSPGHDFVRARLMQQVRDALTTCYVQHPGFDNAMFCKLKPNHDDEYHRNGGDAWRSFTPEEIAAMDAYDAASEE